MASGSNFSQVNIRIVIIALSILIIGCNYDPRNTHTDSSKFTSLADRVKFLNRYLTYQRPHEQISQRTYEALDFSISYYGGKKFPLASLPSWDYRIVAKVPASELQSWIPSGSIAATDRDISWIKSVPTSLDLSGVNEWYTRYRGDMILGVDRTGNIVVCRIWSRR